MSVDPRDTNHDGKVSLMEKVKDKLHLGHKDNETYTSTTHTASSTHHTTGAAVLPATHVHTTTTAAVPVVAAVPAVALAPVAVAAVPVAATTVQSSSYQTGAYDSRDLNRDGHVSTSEKLMSSHGAVAGAAYDSRDLNRDGHISATERLAAEARAKTLHNNEAVLTLHEEQLAISKREVGAGEVGIHKHVQSERVEQTVGLRREEVIVERRPLSGIADPNARIMEQDEILRVPLHREEVIMEKRVVPTEEVIVRKKEVVDNQVVGATLRSEYVDTVQTQVSQNASLTGSAHATGAYTDSRDLNRDGHVSIGEKLKTAPDANRDGHVSAGEKLKAAARG